MINIINEMNYIMILVGKFGNIVKRELIIKLMINVKVISLWCVRKYWIILFEIMNLVSMLNLIVSNIGRLVKLSLIILDIVSMIVL